MPDLATFIRGLPKTDLHMHIEGSIEPEMMFALAERNGIALNWNSPEALRAAYEFSDLKSFLDLYFEGCRVLVLNVISTMSRWPISDGPCGTGLFVPNCFWVRRALPIAACR